jgi:hypothetical protein
MSIKNYLSAITDAANPQANDKLNLIINNEYVIPATIAESSNKNIVLELSAKSFTLLEKAGAFSGKIFFTLDSEKAFNEVWKMVDSGAIKVAWEGDTCVTNEKDFARIQEVLDDLDLSDDLSTVQDNDKDVEEDVEEDGLQEPKDFVKPDSPAPKKVAAADQVAEPIVDEDWGSSDTTPVMRQMWDIIDNDFDGEISPESMESAASLCAEQWSDQMGYDDNDEATAAIIGYFIRRPDGLKKRATPMTIKGYNDDVDPVVNPGKEIIDEHEVETVLAIHPDWRDSERISIVITDRPNQIEFMKDWEMEDEEVQEDFGYDGPLWQTFDTQPPKRREEMTYDEYVALVKHYIDAQANESLSNITRLAKGEHKIIDEAPKHEDPLTQLQKLAQPITVNGGDYSYTCDMVKNSHLWTASDGSQVRVRNIKEIADWFNADPAEVWRSFLDGEEQLSFLLDYGYVRPAKGGQFKAARNQQDHEQNELLGDSMEPAIETPAETAAKRNWETTKHLPMKDRFAQQSMDEGGPDYMSESTIKWIKSKLAEQKKPKSPKDPIPKFDSKALIKKVLADKAKEKARKEEDTKPAKKDKKKIKESFSSDSPYRISLRNPTTGKLVEMDMEKTNAIVFKGKGPASKESGWNCSLWSKIPVTKLLKDR